MYELNGMVYAGNPEPPIRVVSVTPAPDYTLALEFANGEKRVYDFRDKLKYPAFERLRDIDEFMEARVCDICGTVVWGDDLDFDPECLLIDSVPARRDSESPPAAHGV